jgi:hypothetical protein
MPPHRPDPATSRIHEPKVALGRIKVRQAREHIAELAVSHAEPACQGGAHLVNGHLGQQAAVAELVGAAVEVVVVGVLAAQHGEGAVNIATLDRAAHHEMVGTPAVVGAVAIAGEGAAEVARGEGGYLVLRTHRGQGGVEVTQRV